MLLERFKFLTNPLIRQIVALVVCVTIIARNWSNFFTTPLNIVTCGPLSTLFNVVTVHLNDTKKPDIEMKLRL